MRIRDWSSDVCSSDLQGLAAVQQLAALGQGLREQCHLVDAGGIGELHEGHAVALAVVDLALAEDDAGQGEVPAAALAQLGVGRRLHLLQRGARSEEHTSELQSLMRISYAVFCLKKKQTATK